MCCSGFRDLHDDYGVCRQLFSALVPNIYSASLFISFRTVTLYANMGIEGNKENLVRRQLSLTTAWVRIPAWACEKVASDLGLGGGFRRLLRFPPLLTTG